MTEEEFIELTPEYEEEDLCEDDTDVLLKKYNKRRTQKTDDIVAMQAVLCVLIAVLVLASNIFYPDICEPVYNKLTNLTSDDKEVIPNPIDVLLSL